MKNNEEENAGDEEMPYQCNFILIPRREKTENSAEHFLFKSAAKCLYLENKSQG